MSLERGKTFAGEGGGRNFPGDGLLGLLQKKA